MGAAVAAIQAAAVVAAIQAAADTVAAAFQAEAIQAAVFPVDAEVDLVAEVASVVDLAVAAVPW
jgi:hypothetical protein